MDRLGTQWDRAISVRLVGSEQANQLTVSTLDSRISLFGTLLEGVLLLVVCSLCARPCLVQGYGEPSSQQRLRVEAVQLNEVATSCKLLVDTTDKRRHCDASRLYSRVRHSWTNVGGTAARPVGKSHPRFGLTARQTGYQFNSGMHLTTPAAAQIPSQNRIVTNKLDWSPSSISWISQHV